jgi:hypothetical protein
MARWRRNRDLAIHTPLRSAGGAEESEIPPEQLPIAMGHIF